MRLGVVCVAHQASVHAGARLTTGSVELETIVALAELPGQVLPATAAPYIRPWAFDDGNVHQVGPDDALAVHPSDQDGRWLHLSRRRAEIDEARADRGADA